MRKGHAHMEIKKKKKKQGRSRQLFRKLAKALESLTLWSRHTSLLATACAAGVSALLPVIDLGQQPLANEFHDGSMPLAVYPLAVNLCPECFHVQQTVAVNPDLMFRHYRYVSGTSSMLREYFDRFAGVVEDTVQPRGTKRVLDIACNDGSQLAAFVARGWQSWGVDPALNLAPLARATKAQIVCSYWTQHVARELAMTFDAIIAQNVLAHVGDPLAFLEACKLVASENTKIFIQTSQVEMFRRAEFDAIYHEHVSFFSARSMRTLAQRVGLTLENVLTTPVHGGSYVFVLGFGAERATVAACLAAEERQGRYTTGFYRDFAVNVRCVAAKLKTTLESELGAFRRVGYGAAAKGNTLLNFAQIELAYIVDKNPLKQGLLTPGMNIPIYPPEHLAEDREKLAIFVLAWNFFDEIRDAIGTLRSGRNDVLLTCFPELAVRSMAHSVRAVRTFDAPISKPL